MAKQYSTITTPRETGDYMAPHMSPVTPAEDFRTVLLNRITWGAVFAGVAIALAMQLILNLIGIGIGAATLDNFAAAQTGGTTGFSAGVALWWVISGILAALAGGFAAGRLAGEPKESTAAWHGLMSWAVSVLFVTILMTTAAGAIIGGPFQLVMDAGSIRVLDSGDAASGMTIQGDPAAQQAYDPVTGLPSLTAPTSDQTAIVPQRTPAGVTTVDAGALSAGALFGALALILGAGAAWCGGWLGAVAPTMTTPKTQIAVKTRPGTLR